MTARAPTLRQAVEGMTLVFDPAASPGPAVVEFEAPSERPQRCHLVLGAGACRFAPGPAPDPDLRVRTDGETWRRIGSGELDPATAVAEGRLAAAGDLGLLFHLRRGFRASRSASLRASAGTRPPGPVPLPSMVWLAAAFVPWKALWIGLALGMPRTAATSALLLAALLLWSRSRNGVATFFERASVLALSLFAALAWLSASPRPGAWAAASFAALAAIWAAGAARPLALTGEYSRWSYLPALAGTTLFRHPNALITLAWSVGYLACAAALAARDRSLLPGYGAVALQAAVLLACGLVTRSQEGRARERRIDDIDGALLRLRRAGWATVGLAALAFWGALS